MNLLDLMTQGDDPEEKALDRLQSIVDLFDSDDEDVQDEALARAITFCGKQWGGYRAGLELLAQRKEGRSSDPVGGALEALRLREEAEDPGFVIRAARQRRTEAGRADAARAAIIARYGSEEAARAPTPLEQMFIQATTHLAEDESDDAWAPLAGWSLEWHALPEDLRQAVSQALPLPTAIADARAEALAWEDRRNELAALSSGPGEAVLPTACAARHLVVAQLWKAGLPVHSVAELEMRLEFWAGRAGDDGAGYGVVLEDLRRLVSRGGLSRPVEGTKEKARRLKAENPGWSLARIGQELGISRQAVHKHLKSG